MKPQPPNLIFNPSRRAIRAGGFTLVEMMTTLGIFSLIVIAMCSLQVFGFMMTSATQSKLTSINYSLEALNAIRDEVRGATSVLVGNGTGALFTATGTTGTTLKIFPAGSSNYLQVYLNTNDDSLFVLNGTNSKPFFLASGIINRSPFRVVNYQGVLLTNPLDHYAVKMSLQFSQLSYTLPAKTCDYYTLQATMTPRTQN